MFAPGSDIYHLPFMDLPVCLLLLEQEERSLMDHIRDFLGLPCLTH